MKPLVTPVASPPRANRIADLFAPATVVLFAGCGGTCIGIEQAYVDGGFRDRYVDLAINHWDTAVGVHELNHPMTQHLRGDVREIDPDSVLRGRKIAYLHASPDCTHFSKARGSKPKKKEIRGLAWVVVDWAKKRRPDVITLENVEEFLTWGPLGRDGQPCPRRRGDTFRQWKAALEGLGYVVDHRELRACDYGAPTTRKRLFVVARCDGKEIIWPEKTHGPQSAGGSATGATGNLGRLGSPSDSTRGPSTVRAVARSQHGQDLRRGLRRDDPAAHKAGGHPSGQALKPFRTAAECIDWSIPMLSIFATPAEASAWAAQVNARRAKHNRVGVPRRPLKTKTLQRIARGLVKWVVEAKRPYIVNIQNYGWAGAETASIDKPFSTVTAGPKGGGMAAVDVALAPYTVPNLGERAGQAPRSASVEQPMPTVTAKGNGARLVAATIAPFVQTLNHGGEEHRAADLRGPLATVTGANDARALVAALVTKHYGGNEGPGSSASAPFDAVTAKDHNALTVAYLSHFYTSNTAGGHGDPEHPAKCITSGGQHAAVTVAMLRSESGAGGCAPDANLEGLKHPGGIAPAGCVDRNPIGSSPVSGEVSSPASDSVATDDRRAIVAAFLDTYYGNSKEGGSVDQPAPTVVSKDRISLVTVTIDGTTYIVTDIAMRMLTPKELLLAQGFPADYRVDVTADGTRVSKADQVKLIGNAVPPPFARALAFANVVEQSVLGKAVRR